MTCQLRSLVLACLLAAPLGARAQAVPPLNDPANLAGERVSAPALADDLPINHGAAALEQLLRKLRTRASMMLIVAHPDDEDGGLLTYESRGQGARVAMLTLTRGEGGQNLMSGDFDDALGLIRTQELLAADRYMGVDQMFGTEADFGFSKTKEEAFQKWTHDRVLYDAVRAVRLYRPLVLASVFVGGPTDGHGHHQVAGEITQEDFKAAADPNVFPEMIKDGLLPWAPLKVYARMPFSRVTAEGMFDYATGKTIPPRFENYVTGAVTAVPPAVTVTIHEGEKPAIAAFHGMSFVQFARQGLAFQKSQIGPNVRLAAAGAFDVGYTLMGSRLDCTHRLDGAGACPAVPDAGLAEPSMLPAEEESIFAGVDTSLGGMATLARTSPVPLRPALEAIDGQLATAQRSFDPQHVEAIAPLLLSALKQMDELLQKVEEAPFSEPYARENILHELRVKRVELNDALLLALGIDATAEMKAGSSPAQTQPLVPEGRNTVVTVVSNRGAEAITVEDEVLTLDDGVARLPSEAASFPVAGGRDQEHVFALQTPAAALPTQPYFHRASVEQPFYTIDQPALRNAPGTPAPLTVSLQVRVAGQQLEVVRTVAAAAAAQPVFPVMAAVVVPRLGISVTPRTRAIRAKAAGAESFQLNVTVRSNLAVKVAPYVDVNLPRGWMTSGLPETSRPESFSFGAVGEVRGIEASVTPARSPAQAGEPARPGIELAVVEPGHGRTGSSLGYRAVGYPGLTTTNLYQPATVKVTPVDFTIAPGLHIAYLNGTGDAVPQSLPDLGITPTMLTQTDLTAEKLAQYDEVILGVRAYAAHPELSGAGSRVLLDYARGGGVVVVQYNSGGFNPASAPYPYELPGDSAHNVVEEADPVTVLMPDAALLTWPNRITAADFDGWVEERGHGFPSTWASDYAALLETHDPGQDLQKGGLLVAPVGKGAYIYCALALYRQLPEAVPGAYRLFANLLSYAKNPGRAAAASASH